MKLKYFSFLLLLSFILVSCSNKTVDEAFMNQTTGRYLFNPDEIVEVYYSDKNLLLKWRGAEKISPMVLGENKFYVKEMNEKIQFLKNPADDKFYICLIPKEKGKTIEYNYRKLNDDEEIPSVYLKNKQYDKALESYKSLVKMDTAHIYIDEYRLNRLGYQKLRDKEYQHAIEIFKINTALYPESDNVYDSLAEAYYRSGDTISAVENYKKALAIDSGNRRAKRFVEKYE